MHYKKDFYVDLRIETQITRYYLKLTVDNCNYSLSYQTIILFDLFFYSNSFNFPAWNTIWTLKIS